MAEAKSKALPMIALAISGIGFCIILSIVIGVVAWYFTKDKSDTTAPPSTTKSTGTNSNPGTTVATGSPGSTGSPSPEANSLTTTAAPVETFDLRHKDSGLFMNPKGGKAEQGVQQVWHHDVGDHTKLIFNANGTISSKSNPSLCLHPESGPTAKNGDKLIWYPDCGVDHAKFTLKENGLFHDKSGFCAVPKKEALTDSEVILWNDCGGHPVEKVKDAVGIAPVNTPEIIQYETGNFSVYPNSSDKLNVLPGTMLALWDSPSDRQKLVFNENGSIALKSHPYLCIHPDDGRGDHNTALTWWNDCNADQAKWDIGKKFGEWKHRKSGNCVHPHTGKAENLNTLVMHDCNGAHKWAKK